MEKINKGLIQVEDWVNVVTFMIMLFLTSINVFSQFCLFYVLWPVHPWGREIIRIWDWILLRDLCRESGKKLFLLWRTYWRFAS